MTSRAWHLGTTDKGQPGEAQFFDPLGNVILDTSVPGGGVGFDGVHHALPAPSSTTVVTPAFGKAIVVYLQNPASCSAGVVSIYLNGLLIAVIPVGDNHTFIVPSGSNYKLVYSGDAPILVAFS